MSDDFYDWGPSFVEPQNVYKQLEAAWLLIWTAKRDDPARKRKLDVTPEELALAMRLLFGGTVH
jgi:hypothetical protein